MDLVCADPATDEMMAKLSCGGGSIRLPVWFVLSLLDHFGVMPEFSPTDGPIPAWINVPVALLPEIQKLCLTRKPPMLCWDDEPESYQGPGWVRTEDRCVLPPLPFNFEENEEDGWTLIDQV